MSRAVESTVYRLDELSDTAKERARDWWRMGRAENSLLTLPHGRHI